MSAVHAEPIETVATAYAGARAHATRVEGILGSEEMIRKSHSELEAMLDGAGKEWARLMLEENLRLRARRQLEPFEVRGARLDPPPVLHRVECRYS